MMATDVRIQLPVELVAKLQRTTADPRPVVVMTCGIAGSGKSTLSKAIVSSYSTFTRFSIDGYIWKHYGTYGISYPASKYPELQTEAENALKTQLGEVLTSGTVNVVLDFSFWSREFRDDWRALIHQGGGREVLVFFEAEEEVLWRRINERKARRLDADSAAEISRETLRMYYEGFEKPVGEEELTIKTS